MGPFLRAPKASLGRGFVGPVSCQYELSRGLRVTYKAKKCRPSRARSRDRRWMVVEEDKDDEQQINRKLVNKVFHFESRRRDIIPAFSVVV